MILGTTIKHVVKVATISLPKYDATGKQQGYRTAVPIMAYAQPQCPSPSPSLPNNSGTKHKSILSRAKGLLFQDYSDCGVESWDNPTFVLRQVSLARSGGGITVLPKPRILDPPSLRGNDTWARANRLSLSFPCPYEKLKRERINRETGGGDNGKSSGSGTGTATRIGALLFGFMGFFEKKETPEETVLLSIQEAILAIQVLKIKYSYLNN